MMYDDIRRFICQIANSMFNMSCIGHIVYTYNMKTVEQKDGKNDRGRSLPKKIAIITIMLVKESVEKPNKEIEEETLKFLEENRVPLMEKVGKVTVLGNED